MTKYLGWVDLETTGLDHENDRILEFGLTITEESPTLPVLAEYNFVFPFDLAAHSASIDQVVLDMHHENDLWAECAAVTDDAIDVYGEIDSVLSEWSTASDGGTLRIAGSGVSHMDVRFIRHQYPSLLRHFHHAPLDFGVVRRVMELHEVRDGPNMDDWEWTFRHRALSDNAFAIEWARRFLAE